MCGRVLNDAATQIIAVAIVCLLPFHDFFMEIVFTDIFRAIYEWPLSAFAAATVKGVTSCANYDSLLVINHLYTIFVFSYDLFVFAAGTAVASRDLNQLRVCDVRLTGLVCSSPEMSGKNPPCVQQILRTTVHAHAPASA